MSSGLADAVGGLALSEQLAKFKHARVRGLTGRVALNDVEVVLMGFHEPSSRWMVRVVLTGEEVRIKPKYPEVANFLEALPARTFAAHPYACRFMEKATAPFSI